MRLHYYDSYNEIPNRLLSRSDLGHELEGEGITDDVIDVMRHFIYDRHLLPSFREYLTCYRKHDKSFVGICPHCEQTKDLFFAESMTLYPDEDSNYVGFVCRECQQQYYDHWQERWDEYNAGRMC